MPTTNNSTTNTALAVLLALTNGLFTILFYVAVVHFFGIGGRSDVFFATLLLPNVFYTVTFGQLNEILVPFFVDSDGDHMRATAFWNVIIAVSVFASAIGLALLWPMVRIFPLLFAHIRIPPGSSLSRLLLINSVYSILFCILTVKNCYLAAQGRAVRMQLISIPGGAAAFVTLLILGRTGRIEAAPLSLLFGTVVSLAYPTNTDLWSYRSGSFLSHVRSVCLRVRWLVVSASVYRSEPLFDGILSAAVGTGSLSVFYLIQRLIGFIHTAVQNGYILPFTKKLSDLGKKREWQSLKRGLNFGAGTSMILTGVLLVSAFSCASVAGLIPVAAIRILSATFINHWQVFALLIPYGLSVIGAKMYGTGLYIVREERLFMKISVGVFVIGMFLKIVGTKLLGLNGLAVATSGWWLAYCCALFIAVRNQLNIEENVPIKISKATSTIG